jgi:surface-adhesin protein E
MKRYNPLLLGCMFAIILCSVLPAEEDWWRLYHTNPEAGKLYYDTQSIMREENVVDVWSKFVPDRIDKVSSLKNQVRFDCRRRKWKILTSITSYSDGAVVELPQKNNYEPIVPGSSSEVLSNEVCIGDK